MYGMYLCTAGADVTAVLRLAHMVPEVRCAVQLLLRTDGTTLALGAIKQIPSISVEQWRRPVEQTRLACGWITHHTCRVRNVRSKDPEG